MRSPVSSSAVLLSIAVAAHAAPPARLRPIDPLSQPSPVASEAVRVAPDPRPAADKIVATLQAQAAAAAKNAVLPVIVTLHEPIIEELPAPEASSAGSLRGLHIAALEHGFVRKAAPLGFAAARGLASFPIVLGEIPAQRLAELAVLPEVRAIEEQREYPFTRVEGGALLRSPELRAALGAGSGIGVAVLDSGIDWTHPELADRVTAQGDFTGTTGTGFDGVGHGTSVAGIIAGTSGGVAPQAHLWALKVGTASGVSDAAALAALDSVYQNRNEFGGVRLVNMSFGGGPPRNSDCDALAPAYATAFQNLVSVGIAIFVSSGNGGCVSGISTPACVSQAIAVGAVYDAPIGTVSFGSSTCMPGGCAESTAADKITCYSNSGHPLDLLAPSHCATTTRMGGGLASCFGGTSAASPYAAGVAAQILSLRPATTPAELRTALQSTGKPINDPGNGLTRPRVDALAAYQVLASPGQSLAFYTVDPCRLVDTRQPGNSALLSGVARDFKVTGSCGIPDTAQAISINATAVAATGAGHITLYPGGTSPPPASTINFGAGQVRANNAIMKLAADGALGARAEVTGPGQVHLIVDVNGYFE